MPTVPSIPESMSMDSASTDNSQPFSWDDPAHAKTPVTKSTSMPSVTTEGQAQVRSVFSRVFTPKGMEKASTDDDLEEAAEAVAALPASRQESTFGGSVFSRPPERKEHLAAQPGVARDVFGVIPSSKSEPVFRRSSLGGLQRPSFAPVRRGTSSSQEDVLPAPEPEEEEDEEDNRIASSLEHGDDNQEEQESYFDDDESYSAPPMPMGGRLGQFDVMTPIAERTFEYTATMNTRAMSTPSENGGFLLPRERDAERERAGAELDAAEAAARLARELREDEPKTAPVRFGRERASSDDSEREVSL